MAITVKQEARELSRSPLDIDFMKKRYKTETNIFTFCSPGIWVYEKNLYYLLRNSKRIFLDIKYHYKPDYLSYDEYGTTLLWGMLLFVNNVQCIEYFTLGDVYIPNKSSVINICRDSFVEKYKEPSEEINW